VLYDFNPENGIKGRLIVCHKFIQRTGLIKINQLIFKSISRRLKILKIAINSFYLVAEISKAKRKRSLPCSHV